MFSRKRSRSSELIHTLTRELLEKDVLAGSIKQNEESASGSFTLRRSRSLNHELLWKLASNFEYAASLSNTAGNITVAIVPAKRTKSILGVEDPVEHPTTGEDAPKAVLKGSAMNLTHLARDVPPGDLPRYKLLFAFIESVLSGFDCAAHRASSKNKITVLAFVTAIQSQELYALMQNEEIESVGIYPRRLGVGEEVREERDVLVVECTIR